MHQLKTQDLIDYIADLINNNRLDMQIVEEMPDLDVCNAELRVLIETYAAVMINKDDRL